MNTCGHRIISAAYVVAIAAAFSPSACGTTLDLDQAEGVLALNATMNGAVSLAGGARLIANDIWANSTSPAAVKTVGSTSAIIAQHAHVAGSVSFGQTEQQISHIHTGIDPATDPLATLPVPGFSPADDRGDAHFSGSSHTLEPGYYSGGLRLTGGAMVTLEPGVYVFGGSGIDLASSCGLVGHGVMVYLVDSARIELNGEASLTLTPSDEGVYAKVSLFQDRSNANGASISGGSSLYVQGLIYMPAAELVISGGGGLNGETTPYLGQLIIVDALRMSGLSTLRIGSLPDPVMLFD